MKLKLVALAITVMALTSCKKSNDEPTPSAQGSGKYRIAQVNDKATDVKDLWVYSYNADGTLQQIVKTDSNGVQTLKYTYQYNAKGFVSFTSYETTSYHGSSSFTYTADNLVDTRVNYSDLTGSTATTTTVFHYYPNKDLRYAIATQMVGSDAYIDSTVYTNYTNGRPGIKRRFFKYGGGTYSLQNKYLFTYDARMNLIKREATTSSSDSTSFIVSATAAFTPLGTQQTAAWNDLASVLNNYINSDNNVSPENKDVDIDYQREQTSAYSNCGISSKYTDSIIEENSAGYPTKTQSIYGTYNCGVLQTSTTTVSTATYEAY